MSYVIFSDESGEFRPDKYYVRSAFILSSSDYRRLVNEIRALKQDYGIPLDKEFKYKYLWSLSNPERLLRENVRTPKDDVFFLNYNLENLTDFVTRCLQILSSYNPKIITTYTYFDGVPYKQRVEVEKDFMHILAMRVQFECHENNAVGSIHYDEGEKKILTDAYHQIFTERRFTDYANLLDSISFDISEYSIGIQIADYIAGVTAGFLNNRAISNQFFENYIYPNIRRVEHYNIGATGFISLYLERPVNRQNYLTQINERLAEFNQRRVDRLFGDL